MRTDTITIPLSKGKSAVIDAADWPIVSGHRWRLLLTQRGACYAQTVINVNGERRNLFLHRLLMNPPDGLEVDHKDRNGLNCRRENMRLATRAQNCWNRRRPRDGSNPYRGVYQLKTQKQWNARICVQGRKIYLGYFESAEEAARAYDSAAREHHGEFATLNFPDEVR